ncbi:hypothetical protein KIW84_062133 [Lathyrus oleraceus]|uniref:Auxin transport protein BIG n=1 Tax=Pisum sativum TaxID=3888 RepID=A0A9D4W7L7_PEA|nr:hypothetical protein KIW84_062133 [Pisum sativum]
MSTTAAGNSAAASAKTGRGILPIGGEVEAGVDVESKPNNKIPGFLPLSELPSMVLDLDNNNFSGKIPSSLWNSSTLTEFSTANNHLEGSLLWRLGVLPQSFHAQRNDESTANHCCCLKNAVVTPAYDQQAKLAVFFEATPKILYATDDNRTGLAEAQAILVAGLQEADTLSSITESVDDEWGPVRSLNWFATHGTSMIRTNSLVSGDNKGAAARFMEDWFERKVYVRKVSPGFEDDSLPRRISNIIPSLNHHELLELAALFQSPLGRPKAESESFVIVNASQELSYSETVPNSQVHPLDDGFPCSWTYIHASNTGQALNHAILSKEHHQFSNSPVVLKASLRIAAYLPFIVSQAVGLIYCYAECLALHGKDSGVHSVAPVVELLKKLLFSSGEAVQTASSLAIPSRLLQVHFPKQTLLAADDGVESVVPVPGSADTGARNNQVMVEEDTIASSVQYCCDVCSTVPIFRRRWHCIIYPDFDLWEACFEVLDTDRLPPPHSRDHPMTAVPIEVYSMRDGNEFHLTPDDISSTFKIP